MIEQKTFNFQQAIERIKKQFAFDFVALALVQSAEGRYRMRWEYVTGNNSKRYKKIVLKTGKGVAGHVFKTGKPLLIEKVDSMLGMSDLFNYPIVVAEDLNSFGALPLYKYNRVKGVLLVAYRNEKKMSREVFSQLQDEVGPTFGPFYNKEKVEH